MMYFFDCSSPDTNALQTGLLRHIHEAHGKGPARERSLWGRRGVPGGDALRETDDAATAQTAAYRYFGVPKASLVEEDRIAQTFWSTEAGVLSFESAKLARKVDQRLHGTAVNEKHCT